MTGEKKIDVFHTLERGVKGMYMWDSPLYAKRSVGRLSNRYHEL